MICFSGVPVAGAKLYSGVVNEHCRDADAARHFIPGASRARSGAAGKKKKNILLKRKKRCEITKWRWLVGAVGWVEPGGQSGKESMQNSLYMAKYFAPDLHLFYVFSIIV